MRYTHHRLSLRQEQWQLIRTIIIKVPSSVVDQHRAKGKKQSFYQGAQLAISPMESPCNAKELCKRLQQRNQLLGPPHNGQKSS